MLTVILIGLGLCVLALVVAVIGRRRRLVDGPNSRVPTKETIVVVKGK